MYLKIEETITNYILTLAGTFGMKTKSRHPENTCKYTNIGK